MLCPVTTHPSLPLPCTSCTSLLALHHSALIYSITLSPCVLFLRALFFRALQDYAVPCHTLRFPAIARIQGCITLLQCAYHLAVAASNALAAPLECEPGRQGKQEAMCALPLCFKASIKAMNACCTSKCVYREERHAMQCPKWDGCRCVYKRRMMKCAHEFFSVLLHNRLGLLCMTHVPFFFLRIWQVSRARPVQLTAHCLKPCFPFQYAEAIINRPYSAQAHITKAQPPSPAPT